MIEKIQHATASSPEGAKGLVKGVLACAFQNMAFMLPTGLLYLLVKDLLAGSTSGRSTFYLLGCAACFALILLTTWFQYNGTYFTTYKESGTRRLTLAERLRKLPLSFFGKRDLADLTSTIMADCEVLEKDCSHFIPGLFGSLISTVLIALSLFTFEWRMALAALWVIPVSAAIVVGSYRVQDKVQAKAMAAKMACADAFRSTSRPPGPESQQCGATLSVRPFRQNSGCGKAVHRGRAGNGAVRVLCGHGAQAGHCVGGTHRRGAAGAGQYRRADPVSVPDGGFPDVRPHAGRVAESGSGHCHAHQCGADERDSGRSLADRQRAADQSGLRYRVRPCGFAYNSGETVLRDVSFTAKQGEVTALVGPSGGGKTTVSRLAARFWDYQKGSITVGGMEVSRIDPEKLMSCIPSCFRM